MNLLEYRVKNESGKYTRRYPFPSYKSMALYDALSQDYVPYKEPRKYV